MKKSLLAVFISSLLLAGCNEKETAELTKKIQQNEQTITQLSTELEKSRSELTQLQTDFPTLKTEESVLFDKTETVKFTDENKERMVSLDNAELTYKISSVSTNIKWLDDLLLEQIISAIAYYDELTNTAETAAAADSTADKKAQLLALIEKSYADDLALLKEGETIGLQLGLLINYEGQRHNIATFSFYQHSYSGGAHGLQHTSYLNIDTDSRKIITLDELTTAQEQSKLLEALWNIYKGDNDEGDTYTTKENFYVSSSFYFTPGGINFVYPPYALSSYSEGDVTLQLPWFYAGGIINPKFVRQPFISE